MRHHRAFTLVELLTVVAIVGLLIGLLLPSVQAARERARRMQCTNNLSQIGIALQNYAATHEVYPPGVVNDTGPIRSTPRGYHFGWMTQILPYLGEKNLARQFDERVGLYDVANATARQYILNVFVCPDDSRVKPNGLPDPASTSYAACHHPIEAPIAADNLGVFFLNSKICEDDITDGLAYTLFVGEKLNSVPRDLGWASGTRATLRNTGLPPTSSLSPTVIELPGDEAAGRLPIYLHVGGFGSEHIDGAHFLLGDGSVRYISNDIDMKIYQSLAHRSDGMLISREKF